MPIKTLWNIRKRDHGLFEGEHELRYGQDLVALFKREDLARRVLVLLITAGDRMEFTSLGGLEFKPYKPEVIKP